MSGRGGEKSREQQLKGIAAAPGIAIGKVYKLSSSALNVESPERRTITPEEIKEEQGRFTLALDRTRDELLKLRNKISSELNSKDAEIFDAHLMIVEDRMLYDEVMQMIEDSLLAADFSYYTVINRYAAAIAAMPDAYIQERAADIRDVGARVLRNLQNLPKDENGTKKSDEPYIVIAHDLTPSDTAALDRGMVLGFATESGSKTSHSAVLARSMQLPALVGLGEGVADMVDNGDEVIIDGFSGFLIINPSAASKEQYARKADDMNRFLSSLTQEAKLRPETLDGFMVQLSSNIESLDDLPQVKKFGSCGVGLFRSEYMFLTSSTPPDEESQLNTYRSILKELGDEPLIVRTLDVGGDKLNNQLRRYAEDMANYFYGGEIASATSAITKEKRQAEVRGGCAWGGVFVISVIWFIIRIIHKVTLYGTVNTWFAADSTVDTSWLWKHWVYTLIVGLVAYGIMQINDEKELQSQLDEAIKKRDDLYQNYMKIAEEFEE